MNSLIKSVYKLEFLLIYLTTMAYSIDWTFLDYCLQYRKCSCSLAEGNLFSVYLVECKKLEKLEIVSELLKYPKYNFIRNMAIYKCPENSLHGDVFNHARIQMLYLDCPFNYIEENSFEDMHYLDRLSLYYLNFTEIPVALKNLTRLTHLRLCYGELLRIGEELQNMDNLILLDLSKNKIQTISRDAFINNRYIQVFIFDFNNIQFFHPGTFRFCKAIVEFSVGSNALETVQGLLSRDSSKNLQKIALEKNNLKTLPRNIFPEKLLHLRNIVSQGNPWVCDCNLLWLRKFYLTEKNFGASLTCDKPEKFHDKALIEIPEEDLTQWKSGCPFSCNCACVEEREYFSIKVDCSSRNLSKFPEDLPENVSQINLEDNLLTNPPNLTLEALRTLKTINLERNFIKKLNFSLPRNISVVRLANNSVTRFFKNPPRNVSLWTLAGNPWICDCDTIEFRKWMVSQNSTIADITALSCDPEGSREQLKSKAIMLLTDLELCPSLEKNYAIHFSILSIVLFAMVSTIVCKRYHYHLRAWLFSRGFCFLKKDIEQDHGKIHDAFISSADEDFLIVRNFLLPELEGKPPYYSLFEPRRDVKVGELFEYEKEMEEVLKSKRVIVLLSEHYVSNNFLMEIFKFAYASSLEEKVPRLILVILGDLPSLSDDDLSLKAAMESTRCLRFGDKMFRDMLIFAMPKKQVPQNTCQSYSVHDKEDDDGVY